MFIHKIIICILSITLAFSAAAEGESDEGIFSFFNSDIPVLTVEAPFLELHSGPGSGYPVTNVIEKGESISVLLKRTEWLKVKDKRGQVGWVYETAIFELSHGGQSIEHDNIVYSDYVERDWESGIQFGDFDGANLFNAYIGYAFNEVISGELSIGKALGRYADHDLYELNLVAEPFANWYVSPFIGIGGGIINTSPHGVLADTKTRENTLINSKFGIKYYIARNFMLRAEYQLSVVLTDRDVNEEIQTWKLGFSAFF